MSILKRNFSSLGFIGLGQMGYPMAMNIVRKSQGILNAVKVYDIDENKMESFLKESKQNGSVSVLGMSSLKSTAEKSDVVMTILPNPETVSHAYFGKEGILEGLKRGSLVVESSTVTPELAKEIASAVERKGSFTVDAPVSGGINGARLGTLSFMVGCHEKKLFERISTILELMGKKVFYCGPNGQGQAAKIANNMLLGISMIASSEALALGIKMGMDPKTMSDIINSSTGRCWTTENYNPCPGVMENTPASRGYVGGFSNDLMAKDLGIAMECAKRENVNTKLGSCAREIFDKLKNDKEYKTKDFSSVFQWIQDQNKK